MIQTSVIQLLDPKTPVFMVLVFCPVCKWSSILQSQHDVRTYVEFSPHVCQWRIFPGIENHEKPSVPKT